MDEWVDTLLSDIWILIEIPIAIEQSVRVAALCRATRQVVGHRIDADLLEIRILVKVPIAMKQSGGRNQFHIPAPSKSVAESGEKLKRQRPPNQFQGSPEMTCGPGKKLRNTRRGPVMCQLTLDFIVCRLLSKSASTVNNSAARS